MLININMRTYTFTSIKQTDFDTDFFYKEDKFI